MLLEGTRRITDMRHAIDIRHSEWQLRLGKKNSTIRTNEKVGFIAYNLNMK